MKVKTVSILAAAVATAFMASHVPAASAQGNGGRNNGTFVGTPQPRTATPPQRTITPIPSSVILPMGNPVAPMGNPVAPIIQSPFVRYSEPTPTMVNPNQSRGNRGGDGPGNNFGRGRGGRDVVYVPIPVPTSYYPYYSPDYYPEPPQVPVTIPGQLPGASYNYPAPGTFNSNPNAPAPAASTFVYQQPQPESYSEPRIIINEPRPDRVIQPPVVGSTRADVVARLGQPWGMVLARGQETLYYDGLTVVLADSRVIQVR